MSAQAAVQVAEQSAAALHEAAQQHRRHQEVHLPQEGQFQDRVLLQAAKLQDLLTYQARRRPTEDLQYHQEILQQSLHTQEAAADPPARAEVQLTTGRQYQEVLQLTTEATPAAVITAVHHRCQPVRPDIAEVAEEATAEAVPAEAAEELAAAVQPVEEDRITIKTDIT